MIEALILDRQLERVKVAGSCQNPIPQIEYRTTLSLLDVVS